MAEQLTLDHVPPGKQDRSKLSPADQWLLATAENPHLKRAIVDCARQLAGQGRRVTVAVLWEELRVRVHTVGDVYRLNNTWRAPCARWLVAEHRELARDIRVRGGVS